MSANDKIEYLVNKLIELKSVAKESSRKEMHLEKALEKLEGNK